MKRHTISDLVGFPLQREAYNRPTVDESDEPFQWGFPDLNGLRM